MASVTQMASEVQRLQSQYETIEGLLERFRIRPDDAAIVMTATVDKVQTVVRVDNTDTIRSILTTSKEDTAKDLQEAKDVLKQFLS